MTPHWGFELWDKEDVIADHTKQGIEFLEKFNNFMKDRCKIEQEYSKKLKQLIENYRPKKKKKESCDLWESSYGQSFLSLTNELFDLANQHEVYAEEIDQQVCNKINSLTKEVKEERKKALQEGVKVKQYLDTCVLTMERSKKSYEKAFKESEKANEAFRKADADLNLSRAEVNRANRLREEKDRDCEDMKQHYALCFRQANDEQAHYYQKALPSVIKCLQNADGMRISGMKNSMYDAAQLEISLQPIILRCLNGMVTAAQSINYEVDAQQLIDKNKTGFQPPSGFQFLDLEPAQCVNMNPSHVVGRIVGADENNASGINNSPPASRSPSIRSSSSGHMHSEKMLKSIKKRNKLFPLFPGSKESSESMKEDYSDLPPAQRRKKLEEKINSLNSSLKKESDRREGLLKMRSAYEQNPSLGNPLTIDGQLCEGTVTFENLQRQLENYTKWLVDLDKVTNSLSDVVVDGKMTPHSLSANSSRSPPSSGYEENNGNDLYETLPGENAIPFQVIGKAVALYRFEATTDGTLSLGEQEEVNILEADHGDGWTRVQRKQPTNGLLDEGFVPSSYLNILQQ